MNVKPYHLKLREEIKDRLLQIHAGDSPESIQQKMSEHVSGEKMDILLIVYELKSRENGITAEDVGKFFAIYETVYGERINEVQPPEAAAVPGHPLTIFKEENEALYAVLNEVNALIEEAAANLQTSTIARLQEKMALLGQFYSHFNRKEKIIFPILERYGYYNLSRIMWADDDRIRSLYKGIKGMMERLQKLDFYYIKEAHENFVEKFRQMMLDEERFLLPLLTNIFTEADWQAIAAESEAFGYAVIDPETDGQMNQKKTTEASSSENENAEEKHIPFGGGYLTVKEANVILNNLPLEITFVDKHGIFKYFNERIEASDMMFIRTPSSIGRNVANCHPPKSLKKVMRLIRDLKTKKRTSETMWFQKGDKFIHITYKGVFDDAGEWAGILEYVQDIQPFFDLPRKVKKELS